MEEQNTAVIAPVTIPKISFDDFFIEEPSETEAAVKKEADKKEETKLIAKKSPKPEILEPEEEKAIDTKVSEGVAEAAIDNGEVEKIKKRLKDSQSWGRKVKQEYAYTKKTVSNALKELLEDGKLFEEDVETVLKLFGAPADLEQEEQTLQESTEHPFVALKSNLDNEFKAFKKYSKIKNADEKYNAFFSFLAWDTDKQKEKFIALMEDSDPADLIEHIMSEGEDLHEYLYKGIHEKGGLRGYVKSLHEKENVLVSKVNDMREEIKKLKQELDSTTGVVYAKSINSRSSTYQPLPSSKSKFNEFFGGAD